MSNSPRKRRLLIIGAGWEQVPLLKKAREYDCEVIATAPNADAEGFAFADETEIVDPRDLPRLLDLVDRRRIDACAADECDYSHYAAMVIRQEKGWPAASLATAQVTTNKHWMRERCKRAHVMQPRFVACRTVDQVRAAAELIDFPLIVKPVDNRGSFGVRRVDHADELESAFLHALVNAHSREVLVEAFISGVHLTVDGVVDQTGRHHNLAVASKQVAVGEKPIITEVIYPAELPRDTVRHVLECNSRVIAALGIRRGITHSEYIVDDRGRCFLLETANRGGGVMTSTLLLPAITGVDIPDIVIREALGLAYDVHPAPSNRAALLAFFVFPAGVVSTIDGIDAAKAVAGVLHLRMLVKSGDALVPPASGAGRHGFGLYVGDSVDAVRETHRMAQACLDVSYRS